MISFAIALKVALMSQYLRLISRFVKSFPYVPNKNTEFLCNLSKYLLFKYNIKFINI